MALLIPAYSLFYTMLGDTTAPVLLRHGVDMTGLSPRVRGSLLVVQQYKPSLRSIPASAGEP